MPPVRSTHNQIGERQRCQSTTLSPIHLLVATGFNDPQNLEVSRIINRLCRAMAFGQGWRCGAQII